MTQQIIFEAIMTGVLLAAIVSSCIITLGLIWGLIAGLAWIAGWLYSFVRYHHTAICVKIRNFKLDRKHPRINACDHVVGSEHGR